MGFYLAKLPSGLVATTGEVITCKAAVAYEPNKPFTFEAIYVAPPGPNEVRIKMTNAALCQSDLYYLKGKDEDKIFPAYVGPRMGGVICS